MKSVVPVSVAMKFSLEDWTFMGSVFEEATRRRNAEDGRERAAIARAIIRAFEQSGRDHQSLLDAAIKAQP